MCVLVHFISNVYMYANDGGEYASEHILYFAEVILHKSPDGSTGV